MKQKMSETASETDRGSWHSDVYSQVKGPDKKGHVRCLRTKSTSSNTSGRSGPSCSQPMRQDEEVKELKAEVSGLKTALQTVLTLFQRRFADDNNEELTLINRLINGQVLCMFYIYIYIMFV